MSHRILKRVPLDFSAPLDETWNGYINPYPEPPECDVCGGTGYNPETKQLADEYYNHKDRSHAWFDKLTQEEIQTLADGEDLIIFTHKPVPGGGWERREDGYIPTADEVNEHQRKGFLFGPNDSVVIENRAKRLGIFGTCPVCKGEGQLPFADKKDADLYDTWERVEPPQGDGYQLWSGTIDGPITSVFSNVEDLADWCVNNETVFADMKMSRAEWLMMFATH